MIRQGLKCRDCSLIVHESCKKFVIIDCCYATKHNSYSNCNSPTRPTSILQSNNVFDSARSGISIGSLYEWLLNSSPIHHANNHNRNTVNKRIRSENSTSSNHQNNFNENNQSPSTSTFRTCNSTPEILSSKISTVNK